jgi:hypothetical protein
MFLPFYADCKLIELEVLESGKDQIYFICNNLERISVFGSQYKENVTISSFKYYIFKAYKICLRKYCIILDDGCFIKPVF